MSRVCSLIVGPAGHGVVRLASSTAAGRIVRASTPDGLEPRELAGASVVHVHYTDRLFGERCEESAERFCSFAAALALPVVVTLHDLPMPSQGGDLYLRRSASYRRVTSATCATIVSSRHEAELLIATGATAEPHVVPLPIDRLPDESPRPALSTEVGVLGWIYPGKGHATVLDALPADVCLVALGAASPGHEDLLVTLGGPRFRSTGFLSDDDLRRQLTRVGVPVAPSSSISASASIGSWLESGRRPLVLDGPWVRELDQRCPGSLTIVTPETLGRAISAALTNPTSTWLGATPVGPSSAVVAQQIRELCLGAAP